MLTVSAKEVHDELSVVYFSEIFVFGYVFIIIMLPLKRKNLSVSVYCIADSAKNRT
jgi:hypothetical protein